MDTDGRAPEDDASLPSLPLPIAEFAFPGELRDRLVAAVLAGEKTATSCLYVEYEADGEEPPEVGTREVVVDSAGRPVGVIETTEVRVLPLAEVDRRHAVDEGEGYTGTDDWRRSHEEFWHSAEYREAIGRPGFAVDDGTLVVAQRFRLVEDLTGPAPP
ncbi:ASCH domain-containing protein [Nocardiopsis suaedae]|uniref:ASCH domain-containing protein n=1 Tax=Nocardiopsis suaedae TaxID=3018444 RepID=A0ABT4TTI4_9ACTN|nr:ASCH domain-containing protein [Nocardiopsis suaedae]MDA2807988.1 ASCH domain-containing protein [Nocardiopsis suaedae]